jgi:hypothetical protein
MSCGTGPPIAVRAVIIIGTAAAVAFARSGARLAIVYPSAVEASPAEKQLIDQESDNELALVQYQESNMTFRQLEATNIIKDTLKSLGIERIDVFGE